MFTPPAFAGYSFQPAQRAGWVLIPACTEGGWVLIPACTEGGLGTHSSLHRGRAGYSFQPAQRAGSG